MATSPEQLPVSPENTPEKVSSAASEQLEKLSQTPEKAVENSQETEKNVEKASIEAREAAVSVEKSGAEKEPTRKSAPVRRGPMGKKQQEANFKRTIKQVQAELSPGSRVFSKIIHNKTIEKTSDFIGATIARPNAILAGAVVAFALTLIVYVVAKTIGYTLSGFESIAAFIIGWVIGIVYDYLRAIFTGKK